MACIYVCDDDKSLLQFLQDVLEGDGHLVRTAHDVSSFRLLTLGAMPDLAILDTEFPGGGGPAAAELLPAQVPVIVLSGLATVNQMQRFKSRPGIRFLEKPLDLGLLQCALTAMLPTKQSGH